METPLDFLVIIPTYKRPGPLRAAIKTALDQAGVTKQLVVADDCPDGSAADVVQEFPEVLYLRNPQPSGGWPGRVRNFAFNETRDRGISAHYVHFLDDDDTVPDEHYAAVKQVFDSHPATGVVFGILRPFCTFSDDPEYRARQERQLREVRNWRFNAGRFPWIYARIGMTLGLPAVTQWLYRQHAMFGPEMFLCSGGVIRYANILDLGGFPDIKITQDYFFYTEAIRRFGACFMIRESAGYGVGDPAAVWNPLDLQGAAKTEHTAVWSQELRIRQKAFQAEMGLPVYYARKLVYNLINIVLTRGFIPVLDRRNYFADLYHLTDPEHVPGLQNRQPVINAVADNQLGQDRQRPGETL